MAPAADRPGYWGTPTATLEWCEENYAVSFYVAEFWNTLSNLIMILPPLYGAIQTIQDGLEKRYLAAYFGLTAVGLGSWCFHMTLQYEMQWSRCHLAVLSGDCISSRQELCNSNLALAETVLEETFLTDGEHALARVQRTGIPETLYYPSEETFLKLLDELPMIYSCCIFVFCLYECFKCRNSYNYALIILLVLFSLTVTTVYLRLKEPVFHQVMYGLLVSCLVLRSVYIVTWVYPWLRGLAYTSLGLFLLGFILWNVDTIFCDTWRGFRQKMPPILGAVTQFHAWWHILTGLGSYLHILFSLYTRTLYLKYRPKVKFIFGMWPVILVEQPRTN